MSRSSFLLGMFCGAAMTAVTFWAVRDLAPRPPVTAFSVNRAGVNRPEVNRVERQYSFPTFDFPRVPLADSPAPKIQPQSMLPGATPHTFNGLTYYIVPLQTMAER